MHNYNCEQTRHRYVSWFLVACLVLAFLIINKIVVAAGHDQSDSTTAVKAPRASHPYCGIYCIYTAMKLAGQETDIQDLLKPEYIGSTKGSTIQELKKAVEDNGLYAVPIGKLGSRELRNCPHPVVLHVKLNATSKSYNHYELLLRTEKDKARLYDPPDSPVLVPFHELAPRWDGNGLIISAEPINLRAILAPARKRAVIYVIIVLTAIAIIRSARRWLPREMQDSRRKLFALSVTQSAGFIIFALLCGMVYHFANAEGFLANSSATTSLQQANAGNFIPKVSEKKVRRLLNGKTVLIDARYARDFTAGHIVGAINVPVDANDVQRRQATADIPINSRIVMYCQSSKCKYAEIVSIKLIEDGYSNISIFRGGWVEWVAKNGRPKPTSEPSRQKFQSGL